MITCPVCEEPLSAHMKAELAYPPSSTEPKIYYLLNFNLYTGEHKYLNRINIYHTDTCKYYTDPYVHTNYGGAHHKYKFTI